jgi:branched-subunit amino acid aminotransferase/4-amino-4-deoxychorismate lyase
MHTFPLSFERYRRFFTEGVALAITGHHASDPDDLAPPHVKHRSRLHWWRAEQIVRQRKDVPLGATPLIQDERVDRLTETSIGHLLIVCHGVVCTPSRLRVLDGISLRVVQELCDKQGIPFREEHLSMVDVMCATEAMLTGTAFCLAGVSWLEGLKLPWPGPITQRLLTAFSEEVGLDIAGQFVTGR